MLMFIFGPVGRAIFAILRSKLKSAEVEHAKHRAFLKKKELAAVAKLKTERKQAVQADLEKQVSSIFSS